MKLDTYQLINILSYLNMCDASKVARANNIICNILNNNILLSQMCGIDRNDLSLMVEPKKFCIENYKIMYDLRYKPGNIKTDYFSKIRFWHAKNYNSPIIKNIKKIIINNDNILIVLGGWPFDEIYLYSFDKHKKEKIGDTKLVFRIRSIENLFFHDSQTIIVISHNTFSMRNNENEIEINSIDINLGTKIFIDKMHINQIIEGW